MSTGTNETTVHELDVRQIDGAPFDDIVAALDGLSDGETLVLSSGFEPEPLYAVLEARGFDYEATQIESEEWQVAITPR